MASHSPQVANPNANANTIYNLLYVTNACLLAGLRSTSPRTGCKGFDSNGCEVKLWDLRAPERCLTEYKGHSMDVTAVRYCPSSGRLFSVSKDGSLFAWNGAYCSSSSGGGGVSPHVACRRGSGKHFTSLVVHGGPAGAALLAGAFDGSLSRYSFSEDSGSLLLQAATPPFFAAEEEEVV